MLNNWKKWLLGDGEVLDDLPAPREIPDLSREKIKEKNRQKALEIENKAWIKRLVRAESRGFHIAYIVIAVLSCIGMIGVLLFLIGNLPNYGQENPRTLEVVTRYVEKGLEETGAVNIVSGMILDYRAFDTLGESHVLFTAFVCAMILLRQDYRNMHSPVDDFRSLIGDEYFDLSKDTILQESGALLGSWIFLFGIYVLLNGQNSPGGGFSGGAIMGTGLIIFAASFGMARVDKFFTRKLFFNLVFLSLAFYNFAKGYVFFMGANGLENHIPKGTPGALLSGGLILPLDIAVGIVVACTMFGFYSLFRRGSIGGKIEP